MEGYGEEGRSKWDENRDKEMAEADKEPERWMTHENGQRCQKCQSVIKKPWFIFNGQPDSDPRYATWDVQGVPNSRTTPNNFLAIAFTQSLLFAPRC